MESYEKWKKDLNNLTRNNFDELGNFLTTNTTIKGSIFEDDIITQIIRSSLQVLKGGPEEKEVKENILIIDDFDRLDSEHIFRVLNILSIHQNNFKGEDKFGFDKIIIVCSYDNIIKIYEHKYGKDVDFEGYIEKFYSTDVFHFENQKAISDYCKKEFSADLDPDLLQILGIILSFFVSENKISVRSLIKHERIAAISEFELKRFNVTDEVKNADNIINKLIAGNGHYVAGNAVWGDEYKNPLKEGVKAYRLYSTDFPVFKVIQILTTVFGDYNKLKDAIDNFQNKPIFFSESSMMSIIKSFIPLLHVINNFDNGENIFCTQTMEQQLLKDNPSTYEAVTINLPQTTFLNKPIVIPVGWSKENPYDGEVGFYSLTKNNFLN